MKDNLIAVAVLFICFLSAVAFDSYWRRETDVLVNEISGFKRELEEIHKIQREDKMHTHINVLMPHKHHLFSGEAYQ